MASASFAPVSSISRDQSLSRSNVGYFLEGRKLIGEQNTKARYKSGVGSRIIFLGHFCSATPQLRA
jgi:hypothetical protein